MFVNHAPTLASTFFTVFLFAKCMIEFMIFISEKNIINVVVN